MLVILFTYVRNFCGYSPGNRWGYECVSLGNCFGASFSLKFLIFVFKNSKLITFYATLLTATKYKKKKKIGNIPLAHN